MPVTARRSGLSISVFTIDGNSFICDLEEATISVEINDEDARGACDEWEYAWALSRRWQLEYNGFVPAAASLLLEAAAGDCIVVVVFNTGANTYSGTGLLTAANHTSSKSTLQKQGCTIKGQGALAVVAPS